MEQIQVLPLVFVEAFDLNVEKRIGRNVDWTNISLVNCTNNLAKKSDLLILNLW
jgi:hypothetical protein